MQKESEYINNQVWNLHYDSTYDMVYVFIAKIRVIESTYDQKYNDFNFENANLKRVKARLEEVFNALKVLSYSKVEFIINL